MRAFLAVPVAPPAHGQVGELLAGLRHRVDGVRWVDPATVHLTLHFFAELPGSRMEEVAAVIRPVATAVEPFPLTLGGIGSFPPGGRARVLWLGVGEGSAELSHFARQVQDILGRNEHAIDPRPYRAHVTLGRPMPRFDAGAWRRELADPPVLPTFTAVEIILYESAAGHHVRARLPLKS